ncbi:MAG TPA: ribonuclease H-like domain-containing protein [Phycisphaerae bacterium]|nr:ribonuclease H-like domain-containing protein [Phycisphaerae bacterium]
MLIRSVTDKKAEVSAPKLRADDSRLALAPELPSGGPVPLAEAVPGVEVATDHGPYWLVSRTLAEVSPDDVSAQAELAAVLRGARHRFDELAASAELCHVANGAPGDPLFMDIESCGLSGACIFLVGLMFFRDDQLVFDQLLARHYGEEPAILDAFGRRLEQAGTLITFNGKSFDITCIRDRAIFHALDIPPDPPHLDILHEARRRWRKDLPNCKLQTLEYTFCRRRRIGDIPGDQIPDAYHDFVAGSDARRLGAILHHNLLDMLTMGQLLCLLLTGEEPDVDL